MMFICPKRLSVHSWSKPVSGSRKQRAPKIQQPRYRRACCGELIQIDGCDHHWFENRTRLYITGLVDDATSRLMQLRLLNRNRPSPIHATLK
jgi:hypothetical protein